MSELESGGVPAAVANTPNVPTRRPFGWVTRPDVGVLVFVFVALATLFPYFPEIRSANELSRLYLAIAMVDEGTVSIDTELRRFGDISDKSVREGRYYSDKAPGVAFVALPFVWLHHTLASEPTLETDVRIARLVVSTFSTMAVLFALMSLMAAHGIDPRIRRALALAYGLGSLATTYGILLFGHQISAAMLFLAFMSARKVDEASKRGAILRSLAVGLCLALAIAIEYPNVLLCLPIGIFFLARVRKQPLQLLWMVCGALPIALVLGVYHKAAFGSPFATGYSFLANSFSAVHAQGVMGISTPTLAHAYLSFLSPAKGLYYYSPFLLLAIPGLYLVREKGAEGWTSIALVVLSALIVCSMVYPNGGWTVSQRHLTPSVPFMILPLALVLERWKAMRPMFAVLAVIAVVVTYISTAIWPHYMEELTNPFFDLGLPMLEGGWIPPSMWNAVRVPTVLFVLVVVVASVVLFVRAALPARPSLVRWALVLGVPACATAWLTLASKLDRAPDARRAKDYVAGVYVQDTTIRTMTPVTRIP